MKKFTKGMSRFILGALLGTLVFAQTVFAETNVKVIADSAKIRSDADAKSSAVASTEKGKTLTVYGKIQDANGTTWYQVYVDEGVKGYIRGDLVDTSNAGTISDVKSTTDTSTNKTTSKTNTGAASTNTQKETDVTPISGSGMLIAESSNIRNAAVTGDVVVTLKKDAMVTITGETTGSDSKKWYQVTFVKDSKTYSGFIRADLVDTTKKAPDQTEQTAQAEQPAQTEPLAETEEPAGQPVPENVALKSLTISTGTISPEFSQDVTTYTIQTEADTMEIAISGVCASADAQITKAEGFKDLQPGLNAAFIEVTASDGATQVYNFSIICGSVDAVAPEETEEPAPEGDIQIDGAMENVEENTSDMVPVEEFNKYKDMARKRLIIMCILGFCLAVALIIILNLCLKISDLKMEDDEDEEEEDDEEEENKPVKKAAATKKGLFNKPEYVKLDSGKAEQSLAQKEQEKRSEQKPQKSVMMPDLKAEEEYEADNGYGGVGLDDDFEFEFIDLSSKR